MEELLTDVFDVFHVKQDNCTEIDSDNSRTADQQYSAIVLMLHLCTCTAARPYKVPATKKISIDGICFETNQIMKMRKKHIFLGNLLETENLL